MRLEHQGISIWYGTSDAPAPGWSVPCGIDSVAITVAVSPADAGNQVEVVYRVNHGPTKRAKAIFFRSALSSGVQYFRAAFPDLRAGDTVEYGAICYCAGRQVPTPDAAESLGCSFHVMLDARRLREEGGVTSAGVPTTRLVPCRKIESGATSAPGVRPELTSATVSSVPSTEIKAPALHPVSLSRLAITGSDNPVLHVMFSPFGAAEDHVRIALQGLDSQQLPTLVHNALAAADQMLGNRAPGDVRGSLSATWNAPQPSRTTLVRTTGQPLSVMDKQFSVRKVGIALSGGGSAGDFQVGALRFLYDNVFEQTPDIIAGTSVGAINGVQLAEGSWPAIYEIQDGRPTPSSLSQLEMTWNQLRTERDMYLPWLDFDALLDKVKGQALAGMVVPLGTLLGTGFAAAPLGFSVSLSLMGMVATLVTVPDLTGVLKNDAVNAIAELESTRSIFSLEPIRKRIEDRTPYWSQTGPGLRGASVAVGRHTTGDTVIAARGYDNVCYLSILSSEPYGNGFSASPWTRLGDPLDNEIDSDPIFLTDTQGIATGVVVRRPVDGRYHHHTVPKDLAKKKLEVWSSLGYPEPMHLDYGPYQNVDSGGSGTTFGSAPSEYVADLFALGGDGLAWSNRNSPDGHIGWKLMVSPFRIVSGIRAARAGDGTVCAFARTSRTDGWHPNLGGFIAMCKGSEQHAADGFWYKWDYFLPGAGQGLRTTSEVTVGKNGDGRLHVFYVGVPGYADGLWVVTQTANGKGWENPLRIGISVTSNIAVIPAGDEKRLNLFVRGLDYAIWTKTCPSAVGPWQPDDEGWQSLGTPSEEIHFLTDPVATLTTDGRLEVYAVGTDHRIYMAHERLPDPNQLPKPKQVGSKIRWWSPWHSLTGAVWTAPELRLTTVSLEKARVRTVEESGRFTDRDNGPDEPIVSLSDAIIASAAIPAIFAPVTMNGQSYVDGGVHTQIPIKTAVDAGAAVVYAIACDAAYPDATHGRFLDSLVDKVLGTTSRYNDYPDYKTASFVDVGIRGAMALLPTSLLEADLMPNNPWPVPVYVIQPSFNVHDGLTIDAGFIHISQGYGWMRAFDAIMTTDSDDARMAMETSDAITRIRKEICIYEKVTSILPQTWALIRPNVLQLKRDLAQLINHRVALGYGVPPGADSWADSWEYPDMAAQTGYSRPQDWVV